MNIHWTALARSDLLELTTYIAADNPFAARQVTVRIKTTSLLLSEHPRIGRGGRVSSTRELVVPRTPYIIVYRLRQEEVLILRIRHGARRWPRTFG